jgi:hypothetical protein
MRAAIAVLAFAASSLPAAQWIWTGEAVLNPKNRFTYFRRVVELGSVPRDATLLVAADSNARVWINGHVVRRKVTRYHEDRITAEAIHAAPYLRPGRNVVVVLHHNWGPIVTFQRSANRHAGLYVDSSWLASDSSWRWTTAPEFLPHDRQVVGVIGDQRIRYPQIIDGRKMLDGNVHDPGFDDRNWKPAAPATNGPWPAAPPRVETPGQREFPVAPQTVLAAGALEPTTPVSDDPLSIAPRIRTAKYHPQERAHAEANELINGRPATIEGAAGESRYVTFEFHRPVHGYPFLELQSSAPGTVIDFGYGELARSQYSGEMHAGANGWVNPEGVVGPGYADRYITRAGLQSIELPDERTARWLSVQVHFPAAGRVVLRKAGMVKSQYPIRLLGSFDCGDERIRQIVKLGLIHAEVTMSDVYVDTPGREDGQWIEDSRVRAVLAARWFGDAKLRQVLLRHYAESQGKDGGFHPFPPSNFPAYPATYDWSVQWAAMLYDDYYWTGQTGLIERYWDTLERYWKNVLSRVGEDGIFRTRHVLADIRVGVHPESDEQSSGIVTPFMIERLRWSAEMAGAIGRKEQASAWRAAAAKMSEAFRARHMLPPAAGEPARVGDRLDTHNLAATRGVSQAGQVNAILAGLIAGDAARALLNFAFPDPEGSPPEGVTRWNNPTFAYRSLRSLSDNGFTRRAVAHLLERYAPYLPDHPRNPVRLALHGPYGGPLPEYFVSREDLGLKPGEPNTAQPKDDTGSHGWGAVPLLWLHDSLLGVRLVEPGGAKLRIAPEDGGLPYVSGHTMTPKGLVWVHWEPQEWQLEVRIPSGVSAEVVMPEVAASKRVEVARSAGKAERTGERSFQIEGGGEFAFAAWSTFTH